MIEGINLDEGLCKALIRDLHTEKAIAHFMERKVDGWLVDSIEVTEPKEFCSDYLACLGAMSNVRINRMSDNMMRCMKIRTIQHCLNELVDHVIEYIESIKPELSADKFSEVDDREKKLNKLTAEHMPEIIELVLKVA